MYLPNLSSAFQVKSMDDYWITTIGDEDSDLFAHVIFKGGKIHDSYLVVGPASKNPRSYVTLEHVK